MRDKFPDLLRHELTLLAMEPDAMRRAIPPGASLAGAAEDSVITVGDLLDAAMGPRGERVFSSAERQVLGRFRSTLDRIVHGQGRGSPFWSDAAVETNPKWQELRAAARRALADLGQARGPLSPPQQ